MKYEYLVSKYGGLTGDQIELLEKDIVVKDMREVKVPRMGFGVPYVDGTVETVSIFIPEKLLPMLSKNIVGRSFEKSQDTEWKVICLKKEDFLKMLEEEGIHNTQEEKQFWASLGWTVQETTVLDL